MLPRIARYRARTGLTPLTLQLGDRISIVLIREYIEAMKQTPLASAMPPLAGRKAVAASGYAEPTHTKSSPSSASMMVGSAVEVPV